MTRDDFERYIKLKAKDAYRDAKMKIKAHKIEVVEEVYKYYKEDLVFVLEDIQGNLNSAEVDELHRSIRLWLEMELDDVLLDS